MSASITGLDACVASPGELNRIDKKVFRYLRAFSKGKAYEHAATESHDRSWTKATPQMEGATSKSGDRNPTSKAVAGNDGAQSRTPADNGGNMGTAPRRATERCHQKVSWRKQQTLSQSLSLKTCMCLQDCRARRISSNFLWCPFSTTKTSETPSSVKTSNSCEQQYSPNKHSGIH